MYGFLWYLHENHHHTRYAHIFERNGLFFAMFVIPSIVLLYFGSNANFYFSFLIGLVILAYVLSYFIVYDIIIDQHFNLFKEYKIKYLLAHRRGCKVDHKNLGKEDSACFGMLFVPTKYFKI
jgi:beta-carotene 3-hydroxylase